MSTEGWRDSRVSKAAARIGRSVQEGSLGLAALVDAMREVSDDTPTGSEALLMAQALKGLTPDHINISSWR